VDRFIHIIQENDLSPEDIEKVEYTPHPITLNRMWQDNTLRTEEDYAFHGPYLIACAAYRKKSIEFHDPDVREDPRIKEFMKKVTALPNPNDEFAPAMLQDPRAMVMTVTVWAKGETFTETSRYPEWSWGPDEFRATDDQLIEKFNDCVTGFLPSEKIEKAAAALFKLDEYEDINALMELLIP
jgi:2-methylcitrate dehydratase PrpD